SFPTVPGPGMSLLAEEIVEEWLNWRGYFTIRGAKPGAGEIHLLAVKPDATESNGLDWRHVEVQASANRIGYLTPLAKDARKGAVASSMARRRAPELMQACPGAPSGSVAVPAAGARQKHISRPPDADGSRGNCSGSVCHPNPAAMTRQGRRHCPTT